MENYLKNCIMCARKCKVNRYENLGFCKMNADIKVAHVCLHKFEEPCISVKNGSGAVFFSGCNMRCKFCQNYEISTTDSGITVTTHELAQIFLNLEKNGADNINLVSPTIYALRLRDAIIIAKEKGLSIPIIYNTNGYENVETLKELEGLIDIYIPDFKYYTSFLSEKYSLAKNYPEVVISSIKEMLGQVPENIYESSGKMLKGVIIRHLVLPNHILNTKNVLSKIKKEFGNDICISVMFQYFPTYKAKQDDLINRKVNLKEYREVKKYIEMYGFNNGYVQTLEEEEEKYVPIFDKNAVINYLN